MTSVVTCVSPRFIVQVSDRRVTFEDRTSEDQENKTIFYGGLATFAYTGLARLGWTHTDDWLMERLAEAPGLPRALEAVPAAATRRFRGLALPRLTPDERAIIRRTAFVGAGFAPLRYPERRGRRPVSDNLHPFYYLSSNAVADDWSWLPRARQEFSARFDFLPEDASFLLHPIGQPLEHGELVRLVRAIRRSLARTASPWPVARLIANAVRVLADGNAAVGKDLMCNIVRRPGARFNESYGTGKNPLPHIKDFGKDSAYSPHYWSEERAREQEYFKPNSIPGVDQYYVFWPESAAQQVHYGPNLAAPGLEVKGLRFGPAQAIGP